MSKLHGNESAYPLEKVLHFTSRDKGEGGVCTGVVLAEIVSHPLSREEVRLWEYLSRSAICLRIDSCFDMMDYGCCEFDRHTELFIQCVPFE